MAQQNNGNQSRQSTSYPSPHSYPSPSMSAFAFPGGPPQQGQMGGQQNVEQYRASPTGSHGSLASLNLPPIRSIDPRQPQGGPQQQQQPMQGSPLPPGLANMAPIGQFYPHPGQTLAPQQHMNITSSPLPVRYPIPASDAQKVISGGRHKKEVKRRTKTGCLTCRKRRIKCDEGHPTCRNCKKSKRECLGYDPIFKPQPAPTAIQPAPNASSHPPPNQPYPPPPQGYVPVSQNFAHSLSSGVDSPSSSLSQFDYGAPIDPALEGAGSSQMAAPNAFDGGQTYPPPVKAETSTFPSTADGQNQKAKRIKIDELFSLQGIKPPGILPPTSISPERLEEIKNLYLNTYAPAIDKFLEVQWYSSKSLPKLLADSALCSRFSTMLDYFASNMSDKNSYIQAQSLETSVMWSLMDMSSSALTPLNGTSSKEEGNEMTDARDAAEKLKVFAALLTGQTLDRNPMSPAHELANGTALRDQMKGRSSQFWSSMGYYLTQHDDQASAEDEIEKTLSACRKVLDNFENRDVIYSIAVVRHLGHRFPDFPSSLPKSKTNDEREAEARINVAKQFLEDEAAGKGTTQVIQRLCAMAIQSWYVRR